MLTETAAALDTTWVVDADHSTVSFTVSHFGVGIVKGAWARSPARL